MRLYTIDADIMKIILRCKTAVNIQWRLSSSGKGFHISWFCSKRSCVKCRAARKLFDDPRRHAHDQRRKTFEGDILWDKKGTKEAGRWHKVNP